MMTEPLHHFINARLVDPASQFDGPGEVLVQGDLILASGPQVAAPSNAITLNCDGHALMPGLIDLHVSTGEPGEEQRESLSTAGKAAVAGGVTTMVLQPDTQTVIDDAALVDFITRRGRDRSLARVLAAGALTVGLKGERIAELGLMADAGAVMFTNSDRPIVSTRTMQRCMSYASAFDALVASRPQDAFLSEGGMMNMGELSSRLGLAGISSAAETIAANRDIQLAELTGAKLLLDMISSEATLPRIAAAKAQGLDVTASVSVHHLNLNENDLGDYRTFAKLSPPLRGEQDRLALIEGVKSGIVDVIVSGHDPRPAEEKRLPFDEAAFGASALETLLPAALSLYHEGLIELLDLIRAMTSAPAQILGLPQGRIAAGAPADLILVDLGFPIRFDASRMVSKSRNSPYDGRTLQGKVLSTWVAGKKVFSALD
ncbi:dihydroorotase [Aquidulcibacter sp.]|uniref:dihydroorotase n=1 Tax=Aquidulcibacter sp. TaxID=2052990 RepID=UPI0025C1C2DF|nr:dihydroorotase [Aquidulcibacter sp.]